MLSPAFFTQLLLISSPLTPAAGKQEDEHLLCFFCLEIKQDLCINFTENGR